MMDDYMTIGEVARVKKVTAKALRHYEKIGILVPAYVDPDTGYRYYKNEQMLAVDMIKFLHILGIPLKNWKKYEMADGSFDLKGLIEDGKTCAEQKIEELRICQHRLTIAARGLQDAELINSENAFYQREITTRNVLRLELTDRGSAVEFHEKLSRLFEIAEKHHLAANYPSGLIADICGDEMKLFVYVEVFEACTQLPEYKCITGGVYNCIKCPPKSILRANEIYPAYFKNHDTFSIIEADAIISPVHFQAYPVELQFAASLD